MERADTAFLDGGGELGAMMRDHDWSQTPLGPPAQWPKSLKTAVRIMLTSRQPFWLGWGEDLTYLYNVAYKSIIGGKHPDALGRPFRDVWSEIWDVVGPMAERVMTHDEGTYVEAQMLIMERHGYQEETYYTFSYSPVPDDDGGPGGLICANTDDTRRVIGERQLATLREVAAGIANARSWWEAAELSVTAATTNGRDVPFALIYAFDDSDERFNLAASSPGSEALHRASHWGLVSPADEQLRVVDLDGIAGPVPNGSWDLPPRQAVVLPIDAAGETGHHGVLVIGLNPFRQFDESYRGFLELLAQQIASGAANAHAYQQERERAEALAQLDRAKTEFFSNVSHEFRTPLTLMLAPLEETIATAKQLAPADRDRLDVAHRNAMRLLKLVNTLLDFSRMEAGRIDASYEATDLAVLTAELASLFRSAIEGAGLDLAIDCDTRPVEVYIDREMWEKIVFNLLSNAFKFTLEGSVTVRVRAEADRAVLTVRDTGTGIPASELERLFERFHRVKDARGRSFEGSGIGLALVRSLVELHGGSVAVDSELDVGSSFTVSIPYGTAHLPAERISAPRDLDSTAMHGEVHLAELLGWAPRDGLPEAEANSLVAPLHDGDEVPRIVVADDNADMRDYLCNLLAPYYAVEATGDGRRALEALRANPPDLLLTDVMMPELDGFGLLQAVREDPALAPIPVIMLSARAGEEARVDGIVAGADDYLAKPFSARELLARVSARIELNRLEKRLREERSALQSLFAQTPLPTAVLTGPDLTFEMANASYLTVIGDRDIIGKPLLNALPELSGQGFDDVLRQVMETSEPFIANEALVKFDRAGNGVTEDTYWTFIYAPLADRAGECNSVIAICSEVTDQVRAREEIRESEARYRHIFESAGVSIWEEDFSDAKHALDHLKSRGVRDIRAYCAENPAFVHETIDRVRVVDVNDHTVRMFGAPSKEWMLERIDDIFAPETERLFVDELEALWEGRSFVKAETRFLTFDGEPLDLLATVSFHGHGRGLTSVLVTLVDVTPLKRAEEALRESDKRKDEFIAMLGHELRNPLAALRSATSLVELSQPEHPSVRRATEVLDRQSSHMSRLVDGLLEVSRISRGKIEIQREPIDLVSTLGSLITDRSLEVANRGLTLRRHFPRQPAWVNADPVRLAQVFDNLLGNAVKFTEPPGVIDLEISLDDEQTTVTVRDTGIGIRPEACSTIFEAFQQETQDTARTAGGLGLGLALAKGLVELHGGSIEAHSDGPNTGAEFRVTLPTTRRRPRTAAAEVRRCERGHKILLVEDNIDAAEMLADLLEVKGHEISVANSAAAALEALRSSEFELVLCDLGLPGMDGYQFARTVRNEAAFAHIPIVALTGYGQREDRRRTAEAGFNAHLLKPVDFSLLDKTLEELTCRPPDSTATG